MKAALVLLLVSSFVGSFPQMPQTARSQIEGKIISTGNGEPLTGARVSLYKDDSRTPAFVTTTTRDGGFTLVEIPSGRYRLEVTTTGFRNTREYEQDVETVLDLTVPQTLKDIVIRMTPGGVISGRVFDQDGHLLQNVDIQLYARRYQPDGKAALEEWGSTTTNDLGEYRMYWVPPGNYYLLASTLFSEQTQLAPSSAVDQSPEPVDTFAQTFYSDALDDSNAAPIAVGPGAQLRDIDFSMTRLKSVRVSGHVINQETRRPAADATVTLKPKFGDAVGSLKTAKTDVQGNFEIRNVAPNDYILSAAMTLPGTHTLFDQRDVQIGGPGISDLQFALKPYPRISGHIVIEGSDVMPEDKTILLFNNLDFGSDGRGYGTGVEKDGTFTLSNVQPGVFHLELTGFEDNFFIRSAYNDGKDIFSEGLDITESSADRLSVMISPAGGTLDGLVDDDRQLPIANAHAVLAPANRQRIDLFKTATTDQLGRFTLHGLTPGDYKLFAWENIEDNIFFDPLFIERFETHGVPVHVDENGHATASVAIIAAGPGM